MKGDRSAQGADPEPSFCRRASSGEPSPKAPAPAPAPGSVPTCSICSPPTPPPTYKTQAPTPGVWKNGMQCKHFWERRAPQLGAGKRIPRRGVGELSEGGAGWGGGGSPPSIRPRGLASGPRWRSRLPVGLLGRRPPRGRARPPARDPRNGPGPRWGGRTPPLAPPGRGRAGRPSVRAGERPRALRPCSAAATAAQRHPPHPGPPGPGHPSRLRPAGEVQPRPGPAAPPPESCARGLRRPGPRVGAFRRVPSLCGLT